MLKLNMHRSPGASSPRRSVFLFSQPALAVFVFIYDYPVSFVERRYSIPQVHPVLAQRIRALLNILDHLAVLFVLVYARHILTENSRSLKRPVIARWIST